MRKVKAVITGDLVNSSLLGKGALNALLKSIEKYFTAQEIPFGFYRGDSFHALCEVDMALKTACLLRTIAKQVSKKEGETGSDIRMAIGIGKVEEPVRNLGTAKGEAFILSGREMDHLGKDGPRLIMRCMDPLADNGLAAISAFADFLIRNMTIKQAEVVHLLLQKATQTEVALKLGKTQPTINKHASAAHWNELEGLLKIYQKLAGLLVKQN